MWSNGSHVCTRFWQHRRGPVWRSHIRAASTEPQAQSHRCRDDQLPCCPPEEALDALPSILFLQDRERMEPPSR